MSSLTYTGRDIDLEATAGNPARKPFWSRLYQAIVASQTRRAEREIARYLASRGPLTDEVEREIMRRLSGAKPLWANQHGGGRNACGRPAPSRVAPQR